MAKSGRHFLQIPGPTNVPDRVLRALSSPTIDHRGPEFAALTKEVLAGLAEVFRTSGPVVVFPSSGTGAWEAALVNTLSPGDHPPLRPAGGPGVGGRGGAGGRPRAPRPPRRGDPRRRERLGARDGVRQAGGAFELAHRGDDAGRPRRRRAAKDHP